MSEILSQIAAERSTVQPGSGAEFLALQIARALDEEAHAFDYILLSRRYTVASLLSAYQSVRAHSASGWPKLDHFIAALAAEHRPAPLPKLELIAFRLERRHMSLAFFDGFRLDFARIRNLPPRATLAERSIARFASWAINQFPNASVALEVVEGEKRRTRINRTAALLAIASERGIPVWQMSRSELFHATAHPSSRTRGQFRAHAERIFPDLAVRFAARGVLDAGLLGLYVQCKRLLESEVSSSG